MELTAKSGAVVDVTGADLWAFMASHREDEYVLVDVRQPEEYQSGHIPGAKLVPLGEIGSRLEELQALEDKHLVFYCRSGGRSARAAGFAASVGQLPRVYNLLGGFMGWTGSTLTDFPRLSAVDASGSTEELVMTAMALEKGTHRLYEALEGHFAGTDVGPLIEDLARAEVVHAKVLYNALATLGARPEQEFEPLFASLPGKLVESGESFEEVAEKARQMGQHGSGLLLELALELELRAFDLYKSLASRAEGSAARDALLDLAQQEKRHAEGIFKQLGSLASG
jgi:rhodanese-related sulfurtransferase/rubrerythrin